MTLISFSLTIFDFFWNFRDLFSSKHQFYPNSNDFSLFQILLHSKRRNRWHQHLYRHLSKFTSLQWMIIVVFCRAVYDLESEIGKEGIELSESAWTRASKASAFRKQKLQGTNLHKISRRAERQCGVFSFRLNTFSKI